jgi:hypothetical protein
LCCPCYMPKYVPRLEGIMHDPKASPLCLLTLGHISAYKMDNTILFLLLNRKLIFMGCKQRKSTRVEVFAVLRCPKYFRIFFHNYWPFAITWCPSVTCSYLNLLQNNHDPKASPLCLLTLGHISAYKMDNTILFLLLLWMSLVILKS